MSKKRTRNIIIIIIIAVVVFEGICFTGFMLLNRHLDTVHEEAMRSEVEEYMMQDEEFESQYGQVLSVKFDEFYNKNGTYEHNLPCIVETDQNKTYYVWVFLDENVWTKVKYNLVSESKPDNWEELFQ